MSLEILIPSAAVFLTVVFGSAAAFYAYKGREKRRLKSRLNQELLDQDEDRDIRPIIFHDLEANEPGMMSMIRRTSWGRNLDLLTIQADSKMGPGGVATLTSGLLLLGVAIGLYIFHNVLVAIGAAVTLGYIPTMWLKRKKAQRIDKFEKQFPDALDMLTGALRAGLAFPAAIQVVADESPQPMSREFRIVFEENRLGIDMKEEPPGAPAPLRPLPDPGRREDHDQPGSALGHDSQRPSAGDDRRDHDPRPGVPQISVG